MNSRVVVTDQPFGHTQRPLILGVSLKLYMDIEQTTSWARAVSVLAGKHPALRDGLVRLFVLPSLPAVPAVREAMTGGEVAWGAQDLHWDDRGAYTGAVSGADLRAIGCSLVEVGHAERRKYFAETDEVIARKFGAAIRNELTPVLCIGERTEISAGEAAQECIAQLESALDGATARDSSAEIIVAYEPEWAIGRAEPASPEHVTSVVGAIKERLAQVSWLSRSAVIYGGSAQHGTLTALGAQVDGLFLGRFAHHPAELFRIVDEAAALVLAAEEKSR